MPFEIRHFEAADNDLHQAEKSAMVMSAESKKKFGHYLMHFFFIDNIKNRSNIRI